LHGVAAGKAHQAQAGAEADHCHQDENRNAHITHLKDRFKSLQIETLHLLDVDLSQRVSAISEKTEFSSDLNVSLDCGLHLGETGQYDGANNQPYEVEAEEWVG